MKKMIVMALTAALTAGMLAGCGAGNDSKTTTQTPAPSTDQSGESSASQTQETDEAEITYPANSDTKLTMYIKSGLSLSSAYTEYNDVPFIQGLLQRTGYDVAISTTTVGGESETSYQLLLQEKELPNIIYGNICSPSSSKKLYDDGLIVDLTEYMEKYAPDFWEYIHSEGQELNLEALTTNDGKFLCFPSISEEETITYLGPVVRQDWLDECNLTAPVTMDDWENVLTVFKEKYGATLTFPINGGRGDMHFLAGGTGAQAAFAGRWYLDGETMKLANIQPEWKEFLTYMNRWYEKGLLNPDFSVMDDKGAREAALTGATGITYTAMSQLTNWIKDAEAEATGADWVGIPYPVPKAGDVSHFIQTRRTGWDTQFGAVITKTSSEEEIIEACKFLNYAYTEEGIMYWNFGEEGTTYTMESDGAPAFTAMITDDERGMSESLKDYTGMYSAGIGVLLRSMQAARNDATVVEAQELWTSNQDAAIYYPPAVTMTDEETTVYTDMWTAIDTYIKEMALKFTTGEKDLNEFDAFVEALNSMGLERCIEIQQAAYERSR